MQAVQDDSAPTVVKIQAIVLRIIGAAGALTFASFFLLTFWQPAWVETFAADFIKGQVEREVDTRIDKLGFEGASVALTHIAEAIYQRNRQKIEAYRAELKARANERLVECIARMLALDATTRARLTQVLDESALDNMGSLAAINLRLTDIIQGSYLRVVGELKRDLRIFTATNCGCFLLLLLATILRPEAMRLLFVPGMLLLAATLFCSWFYLFEQDWLLTIIYSDYLGFAYLCYLGVAFGFLCDIILNYGRVTTVLASVAVGFYPGRPLRRRRD